RNFIGLRSKNFQRGNFMLMQGKNAGNPDGLPSILTWQKRKLTIENRGSGNFCHPKCSEMHMDEIISYHSLLCG
ncbi:MAG: hypothetical protein IJN99_03995, partial [Clostridia bacterium]|nr:hypothetical protein [Clostridia bacterium]